MAASQTKLSPMRAHARHMGGCAKDASDVWADGQWGCGGVPSVPSMWAFRKFGGEEAMSKNCMPCIFFFSMQFPQSIIQHLNDLRSKKKEQMSLGRGGKMMWHAQHRARLVEAKGSKIFHGPLDT